MRAPASVVFALSLTVAGAACGAEGRASRVAISDSAGIEVVESTSPAWEEGEGWIVETSPVVDLTLSGEGPLYEFYRATDATRLSDGSLVVSDDGTDEIRIFSPDGAHLRTLGGSGQGPGEFGRLDQVVVLPGDSILAYDYWQARATVYGRNGQLARVVPLRGVHRPRPLFPLEGGGFLGESTDFTGFGEEAGLHRMTSVIVRIGEDGMALDTLATIPGFESVVFSRGDAWALWGKESHLAVHGDDVYLGSADSLQYQIRDADGRLKRIVRVPGHDLSLSRYEIQAEEEAFLPDPSDANAMMREVMDLQPDRSHRPAYSEMILDDRGYVWLKEFQGRHEAAESTEWLVFDPGGEWLGSVTLPPRFEVFRIGEDWILGKRPDELDVEHIQLLRLSRGG